MAVGLGLSDGASSTAVLRGDAAEEKDEPHMVTAEQGSWANMEDSRTSVVASVGTVHTSCGHAVRVVEKLPKLVSLTEGCGKLEDKASAFER